MTQRDYDGYLKPHVQVIVEMAERGKQPPEIAAALFEAGVRSPHLGPEDDHARTFRSLIAFILRDARGALLRRRAHLRQKLAQMERRAVRRKAELADVEAKLAILPPNHEEGLN